MLCPGPVLGEKLVRRASPKHDPRERGTGLALADAGQTDEELKYATCALDTALDHHASVLDIELWARIRFADVLVAQGDATWHAEELHAVLELLDAANLPQHPVRSPLCWALVEIDLAAGRSESAAVFVRSETALARVNPVRKCWLAAARGLYGRALWAQRRNDEADAKLRARLRMTAAQSDEELAPLSNEILVSLIDICNKLGQR